MTVNSLLPFQVTGSHHPIDGTLTPTFSKRPGTPLSLNYPTPPTPEISFRKMVKCLEEAGKVFSSPTARNTQVR